jgi:glycosyltransferase involved in cell wall biosynthesis
MRSQGPDSPELFRWVRDEAKRFDAVLLFNYLYYPAYRCLPSCAEKAVLVPLAHDEPPLALTAYHRLFAEPKALLYCSRTERKLLQERFGETGLPEKLFWGGTGMDANTQPTASEPASEWLAEQPTAFREAWASGRYFLTAGRIAEAKDSHLLAQDFADAFAASDGTLPPLLMIGPREMAEPHLLPDRPGVFLCASPASDATLSAFRQRALATLHASRHESLNLAAVESLAAGVPVLAHQRSEATVELINDSGCGAAWESPAQLRALLNEVAARSPEDREAIRARAVAFARERFDWGAVLQRLEEALEFAASSKK